MVRSMSFATLGMEIEIDNLREYAEAMETNLSASLEEFRRRCEREAGELDEKSRTEYYDFFTDDHWRWSDVFPNIMRSSLFIACYSFLEDQMNYLCIYYGVTERKPKGGGIIDRAATALASCPGMEQIKRSKEWQDIKCYQTLRNSIVHSKGRLDSSKKQRLAGFIASSGSKLDQFDCLALSPRFCADFISTLDRFFTYLVDQPNG